MRSAVIGFTKVGVLDPWATVLVNNLLKGGVAWADAEKAKIADLNWRIVAVKPMH
jgi:sterol 24-C-methyltransferase